MKIIYCIHSVYNPGGMERVLLNKVQWLCENTDWEIKIVTTDQHGRPPFYKFPDKVVFTDFGINYSEDNILSPLGKITGYLKKKRLHKKRLTDYLFEEMADVVVSLFPSESSFIPDIKDGSRKVLELHFNRFFRIQYGRNGILGIIDRFRTLSDTSLVKRFDDFVVLTNEDAKYWGQLDNMSVIPNAALKLGDRYSDCTEKRVIAVGRLDYQKGFDRLIEAWDLMMQRHPELRDWHLDIFGQGEWEEMLLGMIAQRKLSGSVTIHKPVKDIAEEYRKSSLLVMSSNFEGFPMVMLEGMGMGLPVVSFAFKCGPRDIIEPGVNGLLVRTGDIEMLADAMARVMGDDALRKRMGAQARRVTDRFSEAAVMQQWMALFKNV